MKKSKEKKMKKRGISPLISWVLLLGFVVALSLIVTTWVKHQVEKTTEDLKERVEGETRCAQVAFNVKLDCTNNKITLANKGKFTIKKIKVREPGSSFDMDVNLQPTATETKNLNNPLSPGTMIDIIPIIEVEEKEVLCSERKITSQC